MTITAVLVACLMGLSTTQSPAPKSPPASKPSTPQADSDALQEFDTAVRDYMTLKTGLGGEVPPLVVTKDAALIVARSDALARAIERGRVGAVRGEFFTARVTALLRKRLSALANHPDVRATIAPAGEEKPTLGALRLHVRFPNGSTMPTMPTVLLDALPRIPASLEYRFIGTTLVLRDVEAALVLDFAPDVFPRAQKDK